MKLNAASRGVFTLREKKARPRPSPLNSIQYKRLSL